MAQATFKDLISMCERVGWDEGIKALEKQTLKLESMQADLYAGTLKQVRKAVKMSKAITKQNIAIGNLKEYRRKNIDNKVGGKYE